MLSRNVASVFAGAVKAAATPAEACPVGCRLAASFARSVVGWLREPPGFRRRRRSEQIYGDSHLVPFRPAFPIVGSSMKNLRLIRASYWFGTRRRFSMHSKVCGANQ